MVDFRGQAMETIRLLQEQASNTRTTRELLELIYTHIRTNPDQRRIMEALEQQNATLLSMREQQFKSFAEIKEFLGVIAMELKRIEKS